METTKTDIKIQISSIDPASSMREILSDELSKRSKANPRYSLRAFARFLDVDPSRLSKMLRGTRPIKNEWIEKFSIKLGLSLEKIQQLQKLNKQKDRVEYKQITHDVFELISDPIHYMILEALKLSDFQASEEWLAKRTNKPIHSIRNGVERLIRVNLLKKSENGKWIDLSEGFSTHTLSGSIATEAHIQYQTEVFEKSVDKLKTLPKEVRDHSSMMMATSKKKIQGAKKKIKKFRRDLTKYLEQGKEKDTIYQLGICLYPLTDKDSDNATS